MELYQRICFNTSKTITKTYSTSFSIAVHFLPKEIRNGIYSIYGFVRLADEIVDTFHHINQKAILENFEKDFYCALDHGISMNPVLHAFSLSVKRYNIPLHLVDSFLSSMKADLTVNKYQNLSDFNRYVYGSADAVGLMCLMVFVNGNQKLYHDLEKPAMRLGSAFQKVNFLRDLKVDIEDLNRNYFPQFNLKTFDEYQKSELIKNIENDFAEASKGIKALPGKSRLAVYIAYIYYSQLLNRLKNTPAKEILNSRIRIANHQKIILLGKSYLKYQLNLI